MIRLKFVFFCALTLISVAAFAQNRLIDLVKVAEGAPAGLLASRSLVLFESKYTPEELGQIQKGFQQTGIDADLYLETEKVLAGIDTERAYAAYFITREIKFIILLTRSAEGYTIYITEFNGTPAFVTPGQAAWKMGDKKLGDLMPRIYRDAWLTQKKQNFLINDQPEMDISVPVIAGRRSELYPIDLKIDVLCVPKIDDASLQAEVDTLFKKIYPYPGKYKTGITVPADEKDLAKQGFQYILVFVKCNGRAAHELLGYDMNQKATAYGSVTYPNETAQIKTISAEAPVYKFYIKHIRSGNVFLGNKWDADETFVQSLKNHIMGFRQILNLN